MCINPAVSLPLGMQYPNLMIDHYVNYCHHWFGLYKNRLTLALREGTFAFSSLSSVSPLQLRADAALQVGHLPERHAATQRQQLGQGHAAHCRDTHHYNTVLIIKYQYKILVIIIHYNTRHSERAPDNWRM